MTSFYERKKTLSVFLTTPKCPLSFKGRVVLSYLAYQDEYYLTNGSPSTKKVIQATGLGEKSVASAMRELDTKRLFDGEGRVREPPREWFQRKREYAGHWHHQYLFWRALVRSPDSPLTHIESAVYGFFLHCAVTNYRPKWTAWYFRHILGVDYHTARRAIQDLITRGLIVEGEDGNLTVLVNPNYEHWWQEASPPVPEPSQLPTITVKVVEPTMVVEPTKYRTEAQVRRWITGLMARRWSAEEIEALVAVLACRPDRTWEMDLKVHGRLNWASVRPPEVIKYVEEVLDGENSNED